MATAGQSQLLGIKQIQAVPLDTHLSCALERVPGFHFYWELPKARFTMLTPLPQRWGLETTPQVGEVILCTSALPTHTVFPLVPSPACTSLLTVSKNNVFMPSTFCEPSAGNSDSEPGEPSRPFTFLGWSLGVSWDEKQGLNREWVV